jgi:D-sedoheptulose 7-phosphate isomerase
MESKIKNCIQKAVDNYSNVLKNESLQMSIKKVIIALVAVFNEDKKVLFCGNGGSAADAQHIAAELSGRFYLDRKPLYAEALHVNSSYMTAVANDYGFEQTYARMVEAAGKKGDVLVGISTSGNSANVVKALVKAKQLGMITVGFTGNHGGEMKAICDIMIQVPSEDTPRIQEAHILIGHVMCELIEKELF